MPPWKTICNFGVKQKTAKDGAYLKTLQQGCFPRSVVTCPCCTSPSKQGEKLPRQPIVQDMLNAERHYGSTETCSYDLVDRAKAQI